MYLLRQQLLLSILAKKPLFDFMSLIKYQEPDLPTDDYDYSEWFNYSTNPSSPNPTRVQKRSRVEDNEPSNEDVPQFVYSPCTTNRESVFESPSRNSLLTVLDIDGDAKNHPEPVSFVTKNTLIKFLTGVTKKPKWNQLQIDTFNEFMRDADVHMPSNLTEVHPEALPTSTSLLEIRRSPEELANNQHAHQDDVEMEDVNYDMVIQDESDWVETFKDGANVQHVQASVKPYDFVLAEDEGSDADELSEEEYGDNELYVDLVDDDAHDAHDEEDVARVRESRAPRAPRIGDNHKGYGRLAQGIRRYREKWDVLTEYHQIPERVRNRVMEFVQKCAEAEDAEYGKKWASIQHTPVTGIVLTEDECEGVEPYTTVFDEVVRDRQFLHDNIPDTRLLLNGSWSMAINPNLNDRLECEVLTELERRIPRELFPKVDESGVVDAYEVLCINHGCTWLDDVRRHGRDGSANGAEDNRQPLRRTASIVLSDIYEIEDPISLDEEERAVLDMYIYTCREMKADCWMSRPLTNVEYAAMLVIWMKCWPYLPKESRKHTPTACQYCIYQYVLDKHMGEHRDNFDREDLRLLANDENAELPEDGTWAGVHNSQVKGTAVIVYSMGNCPMMMVFSKLSVKDGAYQVKDMYEVEPTFCFRFEKGWICILDCIDDLLMLHSMKFEGVEECKTSGNRDEFMHVAMVIWLLRTKGQFYTDTSTLRLTGKSLKYASEQHTPSGVSTSVYT